MSNSADQGETAMDSSQLNEFLAAMEKHDGDNDEGLKKAFVVLSKAKDSDDVRENFLRRAIENRGLKLSVEEFHKTVADFMPREKVEGLRQITPDQFIKIVKLLEEPTVVDQFERACWILQEAEGKNVVLYGKPGIGKTWLARKIANCAVKKLGFDAVIWVYMNRTYQAQSLLESIALQLSLLATFVESEDEERKKKEAAEKDKSKPEEAEKRKQEAEKKKQEAEKKKQEMKDKIRKKLDGKKLLLILDNAGSNMKLQADEKDGKKSLLLKLDANKEGIELGEMLPLESYQVLITGRNQPTASGDIGLMVRPLTWDESKSLVYQEMDAAVKDKVKDLVDFFIGKSERLPVEILIIAQVVSYFGDDMKLHKDRERLEKEKDLKAVDALIRGYKRIPTSVLIDCYSSETHERHFLHRGEMVNFNELIGYWILEGHLGHFDRIEDAYEEGHRLLMELIHCGLLEKQEGNYVAPIGLRFTSDIHDRDAFFRKVHHGLAVTFNMKLGNIALGDGMIQTISSSGLDSKNPSTLFLDGNHIGETFPADRLDPNELENLAIFNPTCQHFKLPIFKMPKLRLLVLRGCHFLDSIEDNFEWINDKKDPPKVLQKYPTFPPTRTSSSNPNPSPKPNLNPSPSRRISERMEKLTVLEISGPSSLEEIPENLFRNMPNLKTLNMSYLQMKLLPSSFVQLSKIEFLILRGCSRLSELDTLKNLKDLLVLDVSGSTSFEKFHDKSLYMNEKLQILNLSQTRIKTLPLINSNGALKFVSLRDCAVLQRIRRIDKLRNLQIFDISGSIEVEEFCDPALESLKSLVILDVSRTAIKRLPSNISNPRCLYVKDCFRLKRLAPIEDLIGVEAVDLSGSIHLGEIRNEFFDKVKGLIELNLSKTSVKHLPFLPSLGTLRRLLLSECESLEELELSSLEELEFLDLSGCKALMKLEDDSFDKMNRLEYLNLSGLQLTQLPSLSKLVHLKELHVRDCPNLKNLPGIEGLSELKTVDHCGTILESTPSFSNPHRPRVFGASMENMDPQQLLEKLGATSTAGVAYAKSEWTNDQQEFKQCNWSISNWRSEAITDETVYGVHFLPLLNKYPSLLANNFGQYHFLMQPVQNEGKLEKYSFKNEIDLRDIYLNPVPLEILSKCVEIRGFENFPPFLGHLLKQANFIVLIDNLFLESLRDLGLDSIMTMKACWVESCDQLEYVVSEKKEDATKPEEAAKSKAEPGELAKGKGKQGEASKSKGEPGEPAEGKGEQGAAAHGKGEPGESAIGKGEGELAKGKGEQGELVQSKGEQGAAAHGKGEPGESAKGKGEGELAQGKGEPGEPSKGEQGQPNESKGEDLAKGESGELAKSKGERGELVKSQGTLEESAKSQGEVGELSESKGHMKKDIAYILESLETLWISDGLKLRSIFEGDDIGFKSLKSLYLEYCPQLSVILSSSSQLEGLEILHVKYCQKLELFSDDSAQLDNLKELHLWGLDGLERIACKAPLLRSLSVGECPLLKHVFDSSTQGHGNLEFLSIKLCDTVKTISESSNSSLEVAPDFPKLQEVEVFALPELQKVSIIAPSLQVMTVGECPYLDCNTLRAQFPRTHLRVREH